MDPTNQTERKAGLRQDLDDLRSALDKLLLLDPTDPQRSELRAAQVALSSLEGTLNRFGLMKEAAYRFRIEAEERAIDAMMARDAKAGAAPPLSDFHQRILLALHKRAKPTAEGLRVAATAALLAIDLEVTDRGLRRGLQELVKAGHLRRARDGAYFLQGTTTSGAEAA